MNNIQIEYCPSTTGPYVPLRQLDHCSLTATVLQSCRTGEEGYYVTLQYDFDIYTTSKLSYILYLNQLRALFMFTNCLGTVY